MNTENTGKEAGTAQVTRNNSGTGFINVMKSAMAAAIGVQSQANRERDFTQGKPIHFIVAGIVATLIFLFCVGLFVKVMIATGS